MNVKTCLRLEKVGMTYKTKQKGLVAIQEVTQEVYEEEFISIIGPSGCGKSTLLEIIAGLRKNTTGCVYLYDRKITSPDPKLGIVFQEESLFPWRTVLENVEFGLEVAGIRKDQRRVKCREIINIVGLQGFEDSHPKALSGGMNQRVAISRALAMDPVVLLMDEPFGALDQQTRQYLGLELLKIWERTRKTVVFVTHDINEAVFLSDRVMVMSNRPSTIKEVVKIDIERPRDATTITTKRFHELTDYLWILLREESLRALPSEIPKQRENEDE
jgi:NitT/TauT family transport system ATP-binding protein